MVSTTAACTVRVKKKGGGGRRIRDGNLTFAGRRGKIQDGIPVTRNDGRGETHAQITRGPRRRLSVNLECILTSRKVDASCIPAAPRQPSPCRRGARGDARVDTAALGPLFPAILRAARVVRPERDPTRMRNRCSAQAGKQAGRQVLGTTLPSSMCIHSPRFGRSGLCDGSSRCTEAPPMGCLGLPYLLTLLLYFFFFLFFRVGWVFAE